MKATLLLYCNDYHVGHTVAVGAYYSESNLSSILQTPLLSKTIFQSYTVYVCTVYSSEFSSMAIQNNNVITTETATIVLAKVCIFWLGWSVLVLTQCGHSSQCHCHCSV